MSALAIRHRDWIDSYKADGKAVIKVSPPCGCAPFETPRPPKGQTWDSLTTCPNCESIFFKVITNRSVRCGEVLQKGGAK